jgi:hypothetical protein
MADIDARLKPVAAELLNYDEENLIEELGMRGKVLRQDFSQMGNPALEVTPDPQVMGPMSEVRDLGWRIAKRWIKELRGTVCGGEAADKEEREKLQSALGLKGSDLAAALAGILMSTFFVASPIAAVVAAIVVKRLGGGALDEFCKKSAEWVA